MREVSSVMTSHPLTNTSLHVLFVCRLVTDPSSYDIFDLLASPPCNSVCTHTDYAAVFGPGTWT
eukprot:3106852-Amphidinium_carterae.1